MDPVAQILAQGQLAQGGEGLGQFYFEGKRLAQQDQQLNLSKQRLLLEQRQQANADAIAPFQQEAARLNNEKTGVELYKGHAEALASVESLKGDLAISQMVARRLADGTIGTPEAMTEANSIVQKTPYAAIGQSYQKFAQQFQIAQASDRLSKQFGTPASVTVKNPITDTTTTYGDTGSDADIKNQKYVNTLQAAIDTAPDVSAKQRLQQQLAQFNARTAKTPDVHAQDLATQTQLETNLANARTPEEKEFAQRQLQNFVNLSQPPGSSTSVTSPDGIKVQIQTGRPAPGSNDAESQKLKEQSLGLTDTAKQIQTSILPNLENIYGPKATLGNFVVDKGFSNLNPELAVGQRIAGREAAKYLYQGVLRQLNKGQRVNAQEQKQLEDTFPALNGLKGMHESPADARAIFQQLQKQLARDSYLKQRSTGQRPDPETLQFLDPDFITAEFKSGRITKEEAGVALTASPFLEQIQGLTGQK